MHAEIDVGRLIAGKYELVRLIGKGAMGEVWLATHNSLGGEFAIKLVQPSDDEEDETAAGRFQLEAQVSAKLSRKTRHIVSVSDHGEEDGLAYLVMELLEGESLSDRLKREDRLSLRACARILRGLCAALDAAHAQGIVHRDIKPGNVFLHKSPDGDTVKVVDFGVARLLDASALSRHVELTATDAIIGTPSYIAPERLAGEPYDGRSDVYSAGVIAYEVLSGRLPYELDADAGLVAKIVKQLNDDPVPLGKHLANVPVAVEDLVMRAIAKVAAHRPTAMELADGFEALLRDLPDDVLDAKPEVRADSVRPPRGSESTVAAGTPRSR